MKMKYIVLKLENTIDVLKLRNELDRMIHTVQEKTEIKWRHVAEILLQCEIKDKRKNKNGWSDNRTYVILQPYSYNPEVSYSRALTILNHLTNLYPNSSVFSPIVYTHAFEQEYAHQYEWYLAFDYQMYEAFKNPYFVFTHDWEISSGCRKEMAWVIERGYQWDVIAESVEDAML